MGITTGCSWLLVGGGWRGFQAFYGSPNNSQPRVILDQLRGWWHDVMWRSLPDGQWQQPRFLLLFEQEHALGLCLEGISFTSPPFQLCDPCPQACSLLAKGKFCPHSLPRGHGRHEEIRVRPFLLIWHLATSILKSCYYFYC